MKKLLSVIMSIVMIATILSVAFPSALALGGEVYYIDSVSGDNAKEAQLLRAQAKAD